MSASCQKSVFGDAATVGKRIGFVDGAQAECLVLAAFAAGGPWAQAMGRLRCLVPPMELELGLKW